VTETAPTGDTQAAAQAAQQEQLELTERIAAAEAAQREQELQQQAETLQRYGREQQQAQERALVQAAADFLGGPDMDL
jgi:molecular chaperone GrpE (heat shock protein)